MNNKYITPEIEVIELDKADIIVTSDPSSNPTDPPNAGGQI